MKAEIIEVKAHELYNTMAGVQWFELVYEDISVVEAWGKLITALLCFSAAVKAVKGKV